MLSFFISTSGRQPCDPQGLPGQVHTFLPSVHALPAARRVLVPPLYLTEVHVSLGSQFKCLFLRDFFPQSTPLTHTRVCPHYLSLESPVSLLGPMPTSNYTCDIQGLTTSSPLSSGRQRSPQSSSLPPPTT